MKRKLAVGFAFAQTLKFLMLLCCALPFCAGAAPRDHILIIGCDGFGSVGVYIVQHPGAA